MANQGLTGFLSGFNASREERFKREYEADQAARAQEARIYEYLLQSRDPEIAALAMSGLFESSRPGTKAKGLRGFMGEVTRSPFYPQVLARMNEMIPVEGGREPQGGQGSVPPIPGGAAMSANQPVRPGSQPIDLGSGYDPEAGELGSPPPMPNMQQPLGDGAPPTGPGVAGPAGMGIMPPTPPAHLQFRRRGTGIPTAEEIALASAEAGIQGKISGIQKYSNLPPDLMEDAILGALGAPRPQSSFAGGELMQVPGEGLPEGVEGPPEPPRVLPTSRNTRTGQLVGPDGQPLPPDASAYLPDRRGMAVTVPDPTSSTGYSRVQYNTVGEELYRAEINPPSGPADYQSTAVIADPTSPTGRTVVRLPRDPQTGNQTVGPAPAPAGGSGGANTLTLEATRAKGALQALQARIQGSGALNRELGIPQETRDLWAREEAAKVGIQVTSQADLAAKAQERRATVTGSGGARGRASDPQEGMTLDPAAILEELERQRQRTAPPPAPPARSRGAGPVGGGGR